MIGVSGNEALARTCRVLPSCELLLDLLSDDLLLLLGIGLHLRQILGAGR